MKKVISEMLHEIGRKAAPKVLIAASECAPLSKTGGLADVVGALPKALSALGIETRIITPCHKVIKSVYADKLEHVAEFTVRLGWREAYVGIEKLEYEGVIIYLVDNEDYFGGRIYKGGEAEIEQYAFFCRAVLEAMPILCFTPDIVHCNDWHTAIIPMLAKTQYADDIQSKSKFLLTIHNIAFQGKCGFELISDLLSIDEEYYTSECLELNGCADILKGGLVFADKINTVSPTYAEELKYEYFAEGLEGIFNLRADDLSGILNGIDRDKFNPHSDSAIPAHFDKGHLKGKMQCKKALQERLGLQQRPFVPIISIVSRLAEQKGIDLIECVLDDLMQNNDIQFVVLGTGEDRYEDFFREAEERYKGRLCAYIGFDEELSRLIYAGSDFYLMPSRFEPCGLSQMIALRYGTIPIVRETGGLRDTVQPYNRFTGEGNGFSFEYYNAWDMRDVVKIALSCYQDEEVMSWLIKYAMESDFGIDKCAQEYAKLYVSMLA